MLIIIALIIVFITIIYTIVSLFAYARARRTPLLPRAAGGDDTLRLLAVLGSGGHTAEMLRLVGALDKRRYRCADACIHSRYMCSKRHYIAASSDRMSIERARAQDSEHCSIDMITRSRQVHQSYVTACVTTLRAFGAFLSF
jgi:beta-1,4-N-acetylglucosaminyltransferase